MEKTVTTAARLVLADCGVALEMLEEEQDEQRWRVSWIGAIALLRAVGHVLRKIDGNTNQRRAMIDAAYRRWTDSSQSEHAVFREFIDKERNNILKEHRPSVSDSAEVAVAVLVGDPNTGYVTDEMPFVLGENLFRPMRDGFGVGEDARDVYRQAVKWWDAELSRLETELESLER